MSSGKLIQIVLPDIGGQQSVQRTEIAVDKDFRDPAMRRDGIDPEFLEAIPADHLSHRLQHTLFGSIPVTFGIVVLRHMLLLGNKYTSFSRINAIFGKNLHFQHKIRKNPQKDPDSRANREPPGL